MGEPAEDVDVVELLTELRDEVRRLRAVTDELLRRRARRAPRSEGPPSPLSPERRAEVYRRLMKGKGSK